MHVWLDMGALALIVCVSHAAQETGATPYIFLIFFFTL